MSGFDTAAAPGRMPTSGGGRFSVTPESLFKSNAERIAYQNILDSVGGATERDFSVKSVKVCIFDLSDAKQRKEYEKLWARLLVRSSKMEVIVDSRKDLVHRENGTSYWMKYVEYVELGGEPADKKDLKKKEVR